MISHGVSLIRFGVSKGGVRHSRGVAAVCGSISRHRPPYRAAGEIGGKAQRRIGAADSRATHSLSFYLYAMS